MTARAASVRPLPPPSEVAPPRREVAPPPREVAPPRREVAPPRREVEPAPWAPGPPPRGAGGWRARALHAALWAGLVLAVAAVGAAAGWAVRAVTSSPDAPPAPSGRAVELGPASLRVPAGWARERPGAAGVPGLVAPAAAFAPAPGLRANAVLAIAPIDDPSLVAAPLRAVLGPPGRPRRRSLAGLPAWTYPPRPVAGDRLAEVTVAPTSAGVVTVVCIARRESWAVVADCADEIGAGSLRGLRAIEPGPDAALRLAAGGVLERLGVERAALRSRLREAASPDEVRRLAAQLARIHAAAAASLVPRVPPGSDLAELVRTLRTAARAYRRLALAAAGGRAAAYDRARRAITAADRALERPAPRSP